MGRNNRPRNTVTQSISFDEEVFTAMEARRKELRVNRSAYLKMVLEDVLEILSHPEVRDASRKAKIMKVAK